MSTDLEEAITATLRPRGDGPIDVAAMRRAAVRQGRAIRRRRLVTAGAGLAAVAVVLGMIPVVRGGLPGGSGTGPGGPEMNPGTEVLALPAADAPGAATDPGAVGKDPTVLHFDVDLTGTLATGAFWSVADGVESVRLWTSDFDHFNHEYQLATEPGKFDLNRGGDTTQPADTRQVTVHGRPATATFWPTHVSSNKKADVPTWMVDWQPVDGLWARVQLFTPDMNDVVVAAEALQLDRSQRCVAPLRLDPPHAGYTLTGCNVDFGHIFAWTMSSIDVQRPDGVRFDIGIGHISLGDDKPFTPNRLVGNRPAMLIEQSGRTELYVPITGELNLYVRPYRLATEGDRVMQAPAGLTDEELVTFASTITVGPNFTNPDTWPSNPVG